MQSMLNLIQVNPVIIHGMVVNIATPNIADVKKIFEKILEFEIIYEIENSEFVFHSSKLSNHLFLHFTRNNVDRAMLSQEHLIIFYLDDVKKYSNMCEQLRKADVKQEAAFNPFWDEHGSCFVIGEDIRIVLCPGSYQHYRARIAAPAMDLAEIENSLKKLGLHKFSSFQDHKKFDGVMLGSQLKIDCHLEFTRYHDMGDCESNNKYSISLIANTTQENSLIHVSKNGNIFEVCNTMNTLGWLEACRKKLFEAEKK